MLANLIVSFIIIIGLVFLIIPGIIFAIKLSFVPYLVMDKQMKAMDKILANETEISLLSVIEVRVSEAVAKERILGRAAEAKPGEGRSDDKEEVFYDRMRIYTDPLKDIQDFYSPKKLLKIIDAERPIEPIVDEMESFIKEKAL
jgi:adenylate kinase